MRKSLKSRLPGILITILLTIALTLFMAILVKTKMLPTKLLLLAGGIFLLFILCVYMLTRNARRPGSMIFGSLMAMLLLIVLMVGTPYLTKAMNTLSSMTGVSVEVTDMGVYVKADSPLQDLNDLPGKNMGIMDVLDRQNTDKSLEEIQGEIGALNVVAYPGLGELADGLMQGDVDAIVLNKAYLDLLSDMEGYAGVSDQMREIHSHQTETILEVQDTKQENGWNILDLFGSNDEEEEQEDRVFTLYLSGIDTRGGMIAKSRSDVNIIATVNVDTRQVLLVSTPRDYFIPLPISNGIPDKLTHAGIYGVDVSMGALEMLYGTEIDYYFRVNFSGFEKIIDALGGITVYSEKSFTTYDGRFYFNKGENTIGGAAALGFARERKAFAEGDRQRGKNQMAVIKAVIDKVMSPAILSGYADLMESVSGNFETSMPYDLIAELVRDQLENGGSWNIVSASVNGSDSSGYTYSAGNAYVMIPNQESVDAAIAKMNQVKNGEIIG